MMQMIIKKDLKQTNPFFTGGLQIFLILSLSLLILFLSSCSKDDSSTKVIDMDPIETSANSGSSSNKNSSNVNSQINSENDKKSSEKTKNKVMHDEARTLVKYDKDGAKEICFKINSEQRKSWCFFDIAKIVAEESIEEARSICDLIDNQGYREECYKKLVMINMDSIKCQNDSLNAHVCKELSVGLCDSITDDDVKNECMAYLNTDCTIIDDEQDNSVCNDA